MDDVVNFSHFQSFLACWTFRPRKKIFSPPPQKNSPIRRRHPPGPSAPPVLENPPPLLGFSIKNRSPQPAPGASDSPFPFPEPKKIKISETSTKLVNFSQFSSILVSFTQVTQDKNAGFLLPTGRWGRTTPNLFPENLLRLFLTLRFFKICKIIFKDPLIGDKFGESLEGSQAPPSFWEVPRLPRKFAKLTRKFFGDFPGSSLTVELNNNPGVPRKFPRLPRRFPKLPRRFPKLPRRSAPFSGKPDTLS